MASVGSLEAKTNFSALLGRVSHGGERIVVTKRGKPTAVLVPVGDLEALEALEDRRDLAEARKAFKAVREGREEALPLEDVAAELGIELPEGKG